MSFIWLAGVVVFWLPLTLAVIRDMDVPNADPSLKSSGYIIGTMAGTMAAVLWPLSLVGLGLVAIVRRFAEAEQESKR